MGFLQERYMMLPPLLPASMLQFCEFFYISTYHKVSTRCCQKRHDPSKTPAGLGMVFCLLMKYCTH